MHALRAVIATRADGQQLAGVAQLLDCLDKDASLSFDVHICSFGGVGSTELGNFLNTHGFTTNLLNDADNLRHCPRPPVHASEGSTAPRCVVYLYGDPLASIASHYRRGQAHHQALKTSANARLHEADFPTSFEEYVAHGVDLFGCEEHFHHWLTDKTTYDILFVQYERMFEPQVARPLLQRLCAHKTSAQGLQLLTQKFMALKKERRSKVPAQYYSLMYKQLLQEMHALPPLFLRDAEGHVQHITDSIDQH